MICTRRTLPETIKAWLPPDRTLISRETGGLSLAREGRKVETRGNLAIDLIGAERSCRGELGAKAKAKESIVLLAGSPHRFSGQWYFSHARGIVLHCRNE